MTFTEKFLRARPPIEMAGRVVRRYHVTPGPEGLEPDIEQAAYAISQPELGCPDDDPAHFVVLDRPWIGCVWELPPIAHERDAWVRHMLVPDKPDLHAYLADAMPDGLTGRLA